MWWIFSFIDSKTNEVSWLNYFSPPSCLLNRSYHKFSQSPSGCLWILKCWSPDARSSPADQIMENICQDRVTLSDINKVVIPLLVEHQLKCHRPGLSCWLRRCPVSTERSRIFCKLRDNISLLNSLRSRLTSCRCLDSQIYKVSTWYNTQYLVIDAVKWTQYIYNDDDTIFVSWD